MKNQFEIALNSGYSEVEILNYLKKNKPDMYQKFDTAKKSGYSNEEIFSYLGKKEKPNVAKEITKEAIIAPPTGFVGQYGNMQDLIAKIMGVEQPKLSPGQQTLATAESQASESILPFLQDEDILPQISKLPTTQELRQLAKVEEPQTFAGKVAKRGGEIYGGGGALGAGVGIAPSLLGGLGGETAKEMGGGPLIQALSEGLGISIKDLAKGLSNISKKQIPSKSGITLPQGIEKGGKESKIIKPSVPKEYKEKILKKVNDQSEAFIQEVKQEKFPISKAIEKGIDIDAQNDLMFKKIADVARNIPEKYETKEISEFIKDYKSKLLEVPVPSKESRKILNIINKEYMPKYGMYEGSTRFFSPKELVDQFRSINSDMKSIYETNLVFGKRPKTIEFYEGFKNAIEKTLEKESPKAFSKLFKTANEQFSQKKKLDAFNSIIEKMHTDDVFDYTKFSKFMEKPKEVRGLKRLIGNDGYEKLKNLHLDLKKAQPAFDSVKGMNLMDYLKSGTSLALLKYFGIPFLTPIKLAKTAIENAQGYLMLSPHGYIDLKNFLSSIKSGNKKAIIQTLIRLDHHVQEYEKDND